MKESIDENELQTVTKLVPSKNRATFEEAITATKFGTFNIILMLIVIPAGWSSVFENTTMSYVFPSAECDLDLSLEDKGMLNAIAYIGMMSSGFVWGYLCDSFGRRKLLFIGYFTDALLVMMSSLSQSFTFLIIAKFLGGMVINGPFAALTTYLTEVHCAKYRATVQMILGTVFSIAGVFLPLMANFILPADIHFTLFDSLKIHPWNAFLLFAAFPPLLAGCGFFLLPESPKFLMTNGRNREALEVFKLIYSLNTGKPKDSYPITKLVNEKSANQFESLGLLADVKQSTKQKLADGFDGMKSLFVPPLVQKLVLTCTLQMFYMMSLNTLRLWIPQLFQAINDYEYYNNGTSAPLCTMLEVMKPKGINATKECVVNTNNSQVYMNVMIISATSVVGTMAAGYLINILGKKKMLFIIGIVSASNSYSLYFATNTNITLILSSIYITVTGVGMIIMLSVIVELFPTNLRTMTISLAMTVARFGAMLGNLLFPVLLKTGCAAPFFTMGSIVLSTSFLSLLLPNTDMIALT
ncbi:hypothetical protein WA026_004109 [Henosepilachna vigintioctopunctata]|uniref:Major facilitator superfamily (MFS) profile domain-containing protein n=1 Tax=Henosepilachna vigintioctopunctata TaxID=420089 RepID=A0AAW1U8K8_9CUCU